MRILLTLLLCLGVSLAHAQAADSGKPPIDPDTKRITYAAVVPAPGATQAELYTRSKLWFASAFPSTKDVIQADEQAAGIVVGKAWAPATIHYLGPRRPASDTQLWYTIKLEAKEGRYRYEITQFLTGMAGGTPIPVEEWVVAPRPAKEAPVVEEHKAEIARTAEGLQALIKIGMNKPATGKDW